jgi:hypothetical protein
MKERRMKGRACIFWNVAIIRLGTDTTTVPKGIRGLLLSIVCCRYRFVRVIVLRGDGLRFDGYCFGIGPTSSVQL